MYIDKYVYRYLTYLYTCVGEFSCAGEENLRLYVKFAAEINRNVHTRRVYIYHTYTYICVNMCI